jgi:hypothetical protein
VFSLVNNIVRAFVDSIKKMHADLLLLMEADQWGDRNKMKDNTKIDFYGTECKDVA